MLKSPINYTGNKYKLLPQILPLIPSGDTFIDLFCGSCTVALNVNFKTKICNDKNNQLINLYKFLQDTDQGTILNEIYGLIKYYNLSKTNRDGFNALRNDYNKSQTPLKLFMLLCHCYNNQYRCNKKGEFNSSFGYRSYNINISNKLINFMDSITRTKFIFTNCDFVKILTDPLLDNKYYIYCDPPYSIAEATYNNIFNWSVDDDIKLIKLLDELDKKNIKWGMSNVLQHKGKKNAILAEWSQKYFIHNINANYSNCCYQTKDRQAKTQEVFITNYKG